MIHLAHAASAAPSTTEAEEWSEAPALNEAALSGTSWKFAVLNGKALSPFLVLAPEGLIGNFFHEKIECWQVVHGRLCLIGSNGLPTIVFTAARTIDGNIAALAGRATLGGVESVYRLDLTGHPVQAAGLANASAARRATFLKQLPADQRRPNLVVLRAGPSSLHPQWLADVDARTRSWDLCLSWYGNDLPELGAWPEYVTHAPNQKKFKPLFDAFYEGSPLWNYERIWLPDDDLLTSGQEINRMFHISRKYGLDLSQPALRNVPECHINHPITAQRPGSDVRLEPFVEIMCPLFSDRALRICIGSIKDAVSGYGLDHLWPSFLGKPKTRMGIIDAVSVVHTRPIGATYDVRGAIAEQAALWNSYGFRYSPIPGVR